MNHNSNEILFLGDDNFYLENSNYLINCNKINADFARILYDTLILGKIYTDVNVTHELTFAQYTKLSGIDVKLFPEVENINF